VKGASCLVPGAWCAGVRGAGWVRRAGRVSGAAWVLGAWCLTGAGCAASAAPPAGAITIALMNAPTNLDPRVGSDEASQKLHQLLYNGLLRIDDQLRVVPDLAEAIDTPDPLTYVVRLRRGVQFHDGHELTSADVVYTFRSFLDPDFVSARKGAYRLVAAVDPVDRYTVRFTLKEPFGSFPVNLVMGIMPDGRKPQPFAPIGTGPFRFVSYAVDDRVTLAPFAEHWNGAPKNAGLVFKVVPDDTMRGLELRKGSVDLVVNDLGPDIVHQLQREGRLRIVTAPGTDYTYIGVNLKDPVLADTRVRHALGFGIERGAIVTHLRRGFARVADGILPSASWYAEPDVFRFSHDPARARQLLDEAGYRDPDGDGPRPRLTLSLKTSTAEVYRLQAAVIQHDLQQVGIALDVRSYEFATLYADVLRGNVQLYTLQWVGVTDPDMLRRVFHSKQAPPFGFNRGYYSNADVDRLIDAATVSREETERRRLYGEAQKRIAADAPYIGLWHRTNVAVSQPDLEGIRLSPIADFSFLKDVARR
jgi:peptide/nickel transport system substrate-binding protein